LTWTPPQETGEHWPLVSGGGFHTHPIIASPDIHLVRQLAALGLGIALTPDAGIPEPGPPLVPVMRDTVGDHVPIRLIVAAAMERLPRIRAFLMEVRRLVREFNPEFVR
ncbi:MAG: LysR family transcriptional regulator, partial [Myxococcota bacterium]